jgi:uncharacterized membrane protein
LHSANIEGNSLKIKLFNDILFIDALTIILILAIVFIPINSIRIILGIPFLLFFPGYMLVTAFFPGSKNMGVTERVILSLGLSIAVDALIGLGLNYTPWGIRLEPLLFSISAFIILTSAIAFYRQSKAHGKPGFMQSFQPRLPGYEGRFLNKTLAVILALTILGTFGTIGYSLASAKTGEKFTEFYILGINGKAENYPASFILTDTQITGVGYAGIFNYSDKLGRVTLGIINNQQAKTIYSVSLKIDGQPASMNYAGQSFNQLEGIELMQGGKWEGEVGFAPSHTGNSQKVEFLLFENGKSTPQETLHLWIDVKGSQN